MNFYLDSRTSSLQLTDGVGDTVKLVPRILNDSQFSEVDSNNADIIQEVSRQNPQFFGLHDRLVVAVVGLLQFQNSLTHRVEVTALVDQILVQAILLLKVMFMKTEESVNDFLLNF
jgi:hypothetical protein